MEFEEDDKKIGEEEPPAQRKQSPLPEPDAPQECVEDFDLSAESDDTDHDGPIAPFQARRRWGLYPPRLTLACDQHPMAVSLGNRTWDFTLVRKP